MLAAVAVVFAIHNRAPLVLDLWPLPYETAPIPVYGLILVALAVGIIAGFVLAWISGHKWRRLARGRGRELAALSREAARSPEQSPDDEGGGSAPPAARSSVPATRRSTGRVGGARGPG